MKIFEIYLISKHDPLYNRAFNYVKEDIEIILAEPKWAEFPITDKMRNSIKPEDDEAYWKAKEAYDFESWKICFAALGGGL